MNKYDEVLEVLKDVVLAYVGMPNGDSNDDHAHRIRQRAWDLISAADRVRLGNHRALEDKTMKQVRCLSGLKGYEEPLRTPYASFKEFQAYNRIYGLARRLGYKSAKSAWDENPTVQGSVEPSDFRIAPSWLAKKGSVTAPVIWVRMGDNSEYHQFGNDFDAVADTLLEGGVEKVRRCGFGNGVMARGYEGDNYISLYWGDKDAQFEKGLTLAELTDINAALRGAKLRLAKS